MQDSLMQNMPDSLKQPTAQKQQESAIAVQGPILLRLDSAYTKLLAHKDRLNRPGLRAGDAALVLLGDLQKLYLIRREEGGLNVLKEYQVSTGSGGFGNKFDKFSTPVGILMIVGKRGGDSPIYTAFVADEPIGLAKPHEAGKALMTSRMLVLSGSEKNNWNTFDRVVRIHGTNKEKYIGKPVSDGCIRMKNADVVDLFELVKWGTMLYIEEKTDTLGSIVPKKTPKRTG